MKREIVERTVITPEQRAALIAAIQDNPGVGHVAAAQALGVVGTRGQIRQALAADGEFQSALREARESLMSDLQRDHRLTLADLFAKLAYVVHDDGNPSQLRAVERAFHFHGIVFGERVAVEHEHRGEVVVTHERRLTLADVVDLARELAGSGESAGGELPAARALLPAPEDR